jgi:transcriptional regulator with XRE-family HTH domain
MIPKKRRKKRTFSKRSRKDKSVLTLRLYKFLGSMIRITRLKKKMSVKKMCENLGFKKPQKYYSIEAGTVEVGIVTVLKIAEVLEVSILDLFVDSGYKVTDLEKRIAQHSASMFIDMMNAVGKLPAQTIRGHKNEKKNLGDKNKTME